ncbi:hypothetical protein N0V93_006796 [Gnomoniopsis smithogilvyi]|uniref:Uncharacterized protein n=1 Tax=Gnomoniopsis smithogilvyi TaxID=1191159 RepID=A0A9W9CVZ3_9PEZI|nr:hypothetical protein N0V93_006796 [Gnomoniopsis smithogilvyi]
MITSSSRRLWIIVMFHLCKADWSADGICSTQDILARVKVFLLGGKHFSFLAISFAIVSFTNHTKSQEKLYEMQFSNVLIVITSITTAVSAMPGSNAEQLKVRVDAGPPTERDIAALVEERGLKVIE